jgi:quinol-cytochrome oxidoreductase complex cytochrome b subunit
LLVLVPRLILAFMILLPITILFSLIPVIVLVIAMLIGLFLPIAFCEPASSIQRPGLRKFTMVMLILFYPVLSALAMLFLVLMVLLYPFLRNKNHHGAYDPFDNGLSFAALYYLKFTVWLINCCAD